MSEKDKQIPGSDSLREEKYGLSRASAEDNGRLEADLNRALADKLMAQFDVGSALARDIDVAASTLMPTLDDIARTLDRAGEKEAAFEDIGRILETEELGDLKIEGVRLNELLSRGGNSVAQRKILRTGFQLLHRKLYSEAAEWWSLNRVQDPSSPFHCVLSLLLAWTYQLQGNNVAAKAAAEETMQSRRLMKL
jgi:hypothetical protein